MSLMECNTAADVFRNAAQTRARLRSVRGVQDDGIDLNRGKIGGRKGSDPKYAPPVPKPSEAEVKSHPVNIFAPELAFVFDGAAPELPQSPASIRQIQEVVAAYFNIPLAWLLGDWKTKQVCWPRHIAMYLCKLHTGRSLPALGRQFNRRDHTTLLNGIRRVQDSLRSGNPDTISQINALCELLKIER